MEGLISIVNDMRVRVVRVGYIRNRRTEELIKEIGEYSGKYNNFEREFLIPSCFMFGFRPSETDSLLHYFMERDGSPLQYFLFQENTVMNQWFSEFLKPQQMTVDYNKVGDVSFYAKNLPGGILPDCLGYLLNLKWRRSEGANLSPFKLRMAEICDRLEHNLIREEIRAMESQGDPK